jgi:chemotaxis methyl-accepting protein methylase
MVVEALQKHMSKDYTVVFINNILIYSDTEDHGQHVHMVIEIFQKSNLKLNHKKALLLGGKENL